MLSISDELNNAFSSTNKEIHVKAEINFSSMELDPSITATSSTAITPDDTGQLVSGNTQTPCSWATMDGTSDMSGNYCMMPESDSIYYVGYFGSVSGADFSCNETIDITSRERTLSKITIHGDNSRQEYPVDYTIKVYNQAVLLHTETVVGSSSVENEVDFGITIADITKIVINITRYSHASTSVKLIGVQTSLSRIFTGQEIESFEIIEEAEVNNNATIPTGNISYSTASINLVNVNRMFDNANTNSPLYNQLKPNSKIDISVGAKVFKNNVPSVEYVKLYSAWTESFDSKDDSMTTSTVAYDRLKRLDLTNMSPQPTLLNQTA
ncbi:MAG: hypothetical protein GY777_24305, partial [Candidatus Brocadiaceae bacterium]|nr:hypothetical protein [Candidatus Brocadiaceae bacterium]